MPESVSLFYSSFILPKSEMKMREKMEDIIPAGKKVEDFSILPLIILIPSQGPRIGSNHFWNPARHKNG